MGRLDGKVALISGGARGQGATEAKLFAQEGAKVVFGDIRDEEGKHVETEIRASGGDAMSIHPRMLSCQLMKGISRCALVLCSVPDVKC